jgi:ABC-type multidrug transport system ATPase subunit
MTVKETFAFAFDCKNGGTHLPPGHVATDEARIMIDKLDKQKARVLMTLNALDLTHVGNTFVGDASVRGVSGGQRRRVSLGEMMQNLSPFLCGDEISTGLDAAATYDICRTLMFFGQVNRMVRVLSLLQPSPETVALFDEVILMAEGKILYSGPIGEVEEYFSILGYQPPDQMDVADFLQEISTDGAYLYKADFDVDANGKPYTMSELAEKFKLSAYSQRIESAQKEEWELCWAGEQDKPLTGRIIQKYQNSFPRAAWLNLRRTLLVWSRDRRFLIANAVKNVIMGVSVGGVFFQTDSYVSIFGVFFQVNLFIMLGKIWC